MVTRFEPAAADVYEELARAPARAPRARDLLRGRLAHRRPGGAAARGAAGRDGGVVHRRPARGAAHRAPGLVGVRGRRRGGVLERGEGGAARRGPGADRGARRGLRAGGRGDGRGGAAALRGGHGGGDHGHRGARTAGPRRSRSGRCAGACGSRTAAAITRTVRLPGDRADIRDRSTTVAMHLLRRVLSEPADVPRRRGSQQRRERAARPHVPGARPPRARPATALAGWRDVLVDGRRDLRPVRPEALHVTLVFLGWQDESAAERIAEAAFDALPAGPPPRLTPRRGAPAAAAERAPVRARPRRRGRPRRRRCRPRRRTRSRRAAGTGPEKRPFWPHITLARVKRGERRVRAARPTTPPPPAEPFERERR